jgi:tetratricopeptide (TPR) repeat protein
VVVYRRHGATQILPRRRAYNFPVVFTFFLLRLRGFRRLAAGVWLVAATTFFLTDCGNAQGRAGANLPPAVANHGRILLVLPFDNRSSQPSLDWIREAAADLLSSRFAAAGFEPTTRTDRIYALDHLGLPEGFQPSRASSLKLAQTLDADSIIVGSFTTEGADIVANASLVDVPHLRMKDEVISRGPLQGMIEVFDTLAWKLTCELDPSFNAAEQTFVAEGKGMRLDAFEQYIRGITEPDQAERLRHLNMAVKLSPDFSSAWMALGEEDYNNQQYEAAAEAFAKVERNGPDGLRAGFFRGLSLLFSGDYPNAERAFADVARVLPLAEVENNEAIAISRQGQDGTALFIQAAADDPRAAVYHFNLAVSLKRHGKTAPALNELEQCLRLRPNDAEAQSLLVAWKSPVLQPASDSAGGGSADPLERIVRTFDAAAFRQAATMLDEMDAARLAKLPAEEQAQRLSAQARTYLDRGLLLEAERLYQSAVAVDAHFAEAYVGLAEVRQRSGDAAAARKEAQAALALRPTAGAYIILAKVDLAANQLNEANTEAGEALKLDPASPAAQMLVQQVQAKLGQRK